ncbi:hypothetical protein QX776_14600 [Alteromonadaceae bacterium BrNp21-10]|nr:hypothetical protein [Alteromonadaceae bacterium BrNp21-10]
MKHLLSASVFAVLSVFAIVFVVTLLATIGDDYSTIMTPILMSSVAAIVSLFILVVWAIPVHLILKRLNQESFFYYLLAAIIPSFIFIYGFKPFGNDPNIDLIKQALFCSFCGCVGAVVFWYITVYRKRIQAV